MREMKDSNTEQHQEGNPVITEIFSSKRKVGRQQNSLTCYKEWTKYHEASHSLEPPANLLQRAKLNSNSLILLVKVEGTHICGP